MTEVKKTTTKRATVKKAETDKVVIPGERTARGKGMPKLSNVTYATGKRKDSIARVYIALGKGEMFVNGKPMGEYFKRKVLQLIVTNPFEVANVAGRYDVRATASGGGLSGQAGAVKHGISKALAVCDVTLRPVLKKAGLLTRDSRVVERKHFGFRKARRSTQFSKR
jgi:small subunit ribosomal protein S9